MRQSSSPSEDPRHEAGMAVRREVLGDAHVDRAIAGTTDFTDAFQDFITRGAWGEVWTRPGIDRRMRSAVTLAILMTLRAEEELAMHVRAALRNGLTVDERDLRRRARGEHGVRRGAEGPRRGRSDRLTQPLAMLRGARPSSAASSCGTSLSST
jgi:4-carboxymuconolactone decarboxylase